MLDDDFLLSLSAELVLVDGEGELVVVAAEWIVEAAVARASASAVNETATADSITERPQATEEAIVEMRLVAP